MRVKRVVGASSAIYIFSPTLYAKLGLVKYLFSSKPQYSNNKSKPNLSHLWHISSPSRTHLHLPFSPPVCLTPSRPAHSHFETAPPPLLPRAAFYYLPLPILCCLRMNTRAEHMEIYLVFARQALLPSMY